MHLLVWFISLLLPYFFSSIFEKVRLYVRKGFSSKRLIYSTKYFSCILQIFIQHLLYSNVGIFIQNPGEGLREWRHSMSLSQGIDSDLSPRKAFWSTDIDIRDLTDALRFPKLCKENLGQVFSLLWLNTKRKSNWRKQGFLCVYRLQRYSPTSLENAWQWAWCKAAFSVWAPSPWDPAMHFREGLSYSFNPFWKYLHIHAQKCILLDLFI